MSWRAAHPMARLGFALVTFCDATNHNGSNSYLGGSCGDLDRRIALAAWAFALAVTVGAGYGRISALRNSRARSTNRTGPAAKNDLIRKFQSTAPWVIFKPAMLFSCYYSMLLRRFS